MSKVSKVDHLYKDVHCCTNHHRGMMRTRTKGSEGNFSSINNIEMNHDKNTRVVVCEKMYIKMLSHREWDLHTEFVTT